VSHRSDDFVLILRRGQSRQAEVKDGR